LEPLLPRRFGRPLDEDESPFPGLSSFQESDSDRFFGRTQEVTHAVARLRRQSILGVLGPSGVGKSSFVRAGLIPALRASEVTWEVVTLRPGRSPLASLGTALARLEMGIPPESLAARLETEPGYLGASLRNRAKRTRNHVLLVVDQLEELFTLGAEPAERA